MTSDQRTSAFKPFVQPTAIPGFSITFGFTVCYVSLLVLLPLLALVIKASGVGFEEFVKIALDPRVISALSLSFGAAFVAAFINGFIGLTVAWVLVRYRFPGRRLLDAAIDLPFALPTAVAGIALTALYAPKGWIGSWLEPLGLKVAYTPLGIIIALMFVGLPFVVRTVQPLIQELDSEIEEAAATLGASRFQTLWRVVLPSLLPSVLTGFTLAFARGVGEYGSVIFIAGNKPFSTEIAPLLIVIRLEEYKDQAASVVALLMLVFSFLIIGTVNALQAWNRKRGGHE